MPEETQSKGYPEYKGYYQPDLPADKDLSSLNEAYQEGGDEALAEQLTPEQRAAYQEGGYEAIKESLTPEQRVAYQEGGYEALAEQLTPEQKKAYQEGGYEALAEQLTPEQKIAYRKGGDEAVDILHSPRQAAMDNRAAYRRALEAVLTGTCEASKKRAQLDTILKDLQPKPINSDGEQMVSVKPGRGIIPEFDHYTGDKRVSSFLRERIEAADKRFQEQDSTESFFLNEIIPKIPNFSELKDVEAQVERTVQNGLLRPDSVVLVTQALNKKRESLQDKYYEKEYLNDQLPRLKNTNRSILLKNVYQEVMGLVAQDIRGGNIRAEQAIEFQQAFNDRIRTLELSGK